MSAFPRMRWATVGFLLCAATAIACGDDDSDLDAGPGAGDAGRPGEDAGPDGPGPDMCGDVRRTPLVYYGTPEPTALPLSVGQVQAVGTFPGSCSGAFITQDWILTAAHCGPRAGARFCVGVEPRSANVCFTIAEASSHGSLDIAVARVDVPATTRLPSLEPIPIMVDTLDGSFIGETAEAAGYGEQEDGGFGEREFTAEPIVDIGGGYLTVDGEGVRGLCSGDSGGPVMVLARDGTVRVAGALSGGDTSCVGQDNYTRADVAVDWIEGFTGPTTAGGGGCGGVDEAGRCLSGMAIWCAGEVLQSERCDAACGWDAGAAGFRCIEGADPCMGIDGEGRCDGDTARWCEGGVVRSRDCAACGETCGRVAEVGGVYCQPDPCEGIDFLGECRGDVAVWCDEGSLQMRDCSRRGGRCAYVNDEIGYFCVR